MNVHHIRYRDLTDVLLDDLVVLKRECHEDFHAALALKRGRIENYELPAIIELIQWYRTTPEAVTRKEKIKTKKAVRIARGKNYGKLCRRAINRFQAGGSTRDGVILLIARLQELVATWPDPLIETLLNHSADEAPAIETICEVVATAPIDPMTLRSERGGWKKATILKLGVSWPPPRGWLKNLKAEYSCDTKKHV